MHNVISADMKQEQTNLGTIVKDSSEDTDELDHLF